MATLEQFLQTGELGPIHPGMTQAEVMAWLGPPQDNSVTRLPKILKYGGMQLTFARSQASIHPALSLIALYFGPQAEPIPEPVRPTDFTGRGETTIAEFGEFLRQVDQKASASVEGEDTSYLVMPSGARITFDGPALHSIMFALRSQAPPKKQISISIPEDAWQELNTLARQSNRSVAELCAQWITQRAGNHSETAK
jgi:hypothetical protein